MIKTMILLITLLLSQVASATSCENLTYELSNIQKAQSKLKAGSEDDAEELTALQIQYDQKMAKLSMYKAIVELRDNYKKAMDRLAQSKSETLNQIKESLQTKMLTLEKMSVMSMMISDALQNRGFAGDENIGLDNIKQYASSPDSFAERIWRICKVNARQGHDISQILLCKSIDTNVISSHDPYSNEAEAEFSRFKRTFDSTYSEAITSFYKVYAGDNLDEETRTRDLVNYQNALTENIPEFELTDDKLSLANLDSLTFADQTYLEAIEKYQQESGVEALKNATTYEDIIKLCDDPSKEDECNEKGQALAKTIEDYASFAENFGAANKISSDFKNMFTEQIEGLRETFADKDQQVTLDSLLSEEMEKQLKSSLQSNLKMQKLHTQMVGAEFDDTQLNDLGKPNSETHYQMYLDQMNEGGLCDSAIQTGNTKDDLFSCIGALALDGNLNGDLAKNITDLESQLKATKIKINAIKSSNDFKELERFKVVLAREAKKVCGQENFKPDDDVVTTCMSDYLDNCMSNGMNSLTLLNEVAIELEEKIPFFSRTQNRHDDIERYCSRGNLKSLAPYSCTSIATNNQLNRTYKRYVNGKSAYGQRESFGNIFNTALSRELPNFANTYMNIRFYQPLTYDSLYYNALATKNYLYQRDEWNSYWENYWDNYDYSNSSSYSSIYNSSSTYTSIYSD